MQCLALTFKEEDLAGITVNRWAHGYSYEYNSLFDNVFFDGRMPDSMITREVSSRDGKKTNWKYLNRKL